MLKSPHAALLLVLLAAPVSPGAKAADTMPPEIAAIVKRMATGAEPSPADEQKLEAWTASMEAASNPAPAAPGATASPANSSAAAAPQGANPSVSAPAAGTTSLTASDRPGGEACPAPGQAAGLSVPASQAAFLAMAKDAIRGYGSQVPQEGRAAIEAALADRTQPVAGADLAAAFVARGHGSAGVLAAAQGAVANPADAVTASTLGSLLRGMGDYKRAAIAMNYAATLSPGSATLAGNRGWLAMSQGDTQAAAGLFATAAKAGPPAPMVLLGQALIEECAGRHAQALPLFRASLAMQWTDMAAAGIQWASGSIRQDAAKAGTTPDLGSPDQYGGKPGGAGGDTPDWPDPPLPPTAQELAGNLRAGYPASPLARYAAGWNDAVASDLRTAIANPPRRSETIIDDTGTTITYGYDRQLFMLDDIFAMIDARYGPGYDRFTRQTSDALERDGTMLHNTDPATDAMSCGTVRARNTATYLGYGAIAKGRWTDVRKAMADLYGFSRPVLASIDDGTTNANANAILASRANLMAAGYATDLLFWNMEANAAWRFKDFQCTGVPSKPRPVGRLKPYKIDPNACHAGELHMNFGIINLNADCTHMNLTFGQLLQGSVDYKFGKDWGDDTVTLWAGAGFGTNGSNTKGAVTVGAQAGVYATLGAGGSVVDAGISAQGGVTVGATNAAAMPGGSFGPAPPPPDIASNQGGVSAQATVTARISLIDGPPNPASGSRTMAGDGEITTTSGMTFGANATSSTTSGRAMHVPP